MQFAQRIQFLTGSAARTILSNCQSRLITSFAGGLPGKEAFQDLELPQVETRFLQYGASEGELILRRQLQTQLQALELEVSTEQIIITSGSQQGLDLVAKLWIDPGSPVLIESPSYLAAIQVFALFQADICCIPLGLDGGLDPDAFEVMLKQRRPRFVYLNPTFQNPSGYVYTEAERATVAAILDRYADQTVLIEDDPYRGLYYQQTPPAAPIVSYLEKAKWVYLGTTSKVLIPGARIGYVVASPEFTDALLKLKQAADLHSNRLAQCMVSMLLSDSDWMSERLKKLRSVYSERRAVMHEVLGDCASTIAEWKLPEGGMFFWLKLRRKMDLQLALRNAIEKGVAFMPGDPFYSRKQDGGMNLRLNFTGVESLDIRNKLPIVFDTLKALGN